MKLLVDEPSNVNCRDGSVDGADAVAMPVSVRSSAHTLNLPIVPMKDLPKSRSVVSRSGKATGVVLAVRAVPSIAPLMNVEPCRELMLKGTLMPSEYEEPLLSTVSSKLGVLC